MSLAKLALPAAIKFVTFGDIKGNDFSDILDSLKPNDMGRKDSIEGDLAAKQRTNKTSKKQ